VIRIRKPKKAPAVLRLKGKAAAAALCASYDAAPAEFADGRRWFEDFDQAIYGGESVKKALLRAQFDKCAFCESQVTAVSYGDVEHLRPKAGFKQNADDSLGRPGYYWLAYTWTNLYFACQICNQRFKRNLFPLANPERRARYHRHRVSRERPLLVDPGKKDPADFLVFDGEYARPVDGCLDGTTTIEVLGLNREELAARRRGSLAELRLLLESRDNIARRLESGTATAAEEALLGKIDTHFGEQQSDRAEYAAMMRAALAKARITP
jgi:hypothetical protein